MTDKPVVSETPAPRDGITRDENGRYIALSTTRAVFDTYDGAVAFMKGVGSPETPAPAGTEK